MGGQEEEMELTVILKQTNFVLGRPRKERKYL